MTFLTLAFIQENMPFVTLYYATLGMTLTIAAARA